MTTDAETKTTEDAPPREGDLMVWFIPAIPGKAFRRRARSMREAVAVLNALSFYTLFLEDDLNLMDDHANAGGISRWEVDGEGGYDWYDIDETELRDMGFDA